MHEGEGFISCIFTERDRESGGGGGGCEGGGEERRGTPYQSKCRSVKARSTEFSLTERKRGGGGGEEGRGETPYQNKNARG